MLFSFGSTDARSHGLVDFLLHEQLALDTGASYSGIDPDLADRLSLFDREGSEINGYIVRGNPLDGRLVRENVTLLADVGA